MANNVLRQVASDLQATEFFTVMIDECTDLANREQVSIQIDHNKNYVKCMLKVAVKISHS